MSGDELGRGPYPLRSPALGDQSVLFRTMLKQVADMLTPEDVESLAYIHSVQKAGKGEAVTALSLFRELEAKGVFSADDVEPLEEVLGGINRLDVANTVVKDFKVKLKGVRRSGSDSQLTQHVTWQNKKAHVSMDSDNSSSHHHTSSTHNLPSQTTTILHSEAPAQTGQAGWQQPHPSSHPTESVSLASLSKDEKKELLRSIMSDPDMREELPSLLEPALQASINPLLTLKGGLCLPPASPPEGGALTSRARELDAMSRPHSSSSSSPEVTSPASPLNNGPVGRQRCGGSLSSEVSGRTSTSGIASSPESSLTRPPERQTSSSSQEFVDVTSIHPVSTCSAPKLMPHCRPRTSMTWDGHRRMEWSIVRKDLAQRIVCHSNVPFIRGNFSLKADGIRSRFRKPVSLVFKIFPYGAGKDENQSLTLEVVVDCRSSELQALGMLNLTTTVSINQGHEFISSKNHRHTLKTFTLHDFLPHEVVTRSPSSTVDFAMEAHITFDVGSPPGPQGLLELSEPEEES